MTLARTAMAVAVTAALGLPAFAAEDMATLKAELKRLSERIENLERHNKGMEQALNTERLSEKEPEIASRLKAVEFQTLSMQKQARQPTT